MLVCPESSCEYYQISQYTSPADNTCKYKIRIRMSVVHRFHCLYTQPLFAPEFGNPGSHRNRLILWEHTHCFKWCLLFCGVWDHCKPLENCDWYMPIGLHFNSDKRYPNQHEHSWPVREDPLPWKHFHSIKIIPVSIPDVMLHNNWVLPEQRTVLRNK